MILDSQGMFSDDQAITASAASENYIDLQVAADIGPGNPIPIIVQVTSDFASGATDGTLQVALQVDSDSAFGSATTVVQTAAVAEATLVAGYTFSLEYIPRSTNERYARLYYTVTGTGDFTAGNVTAAVVAAHQSNNANTP